MTVPVTRDNRPRRPRVDAATLWPGGIATAVVAGLVALVGVLVSRWLFNVPILAPQRAGTYGDVHTTGLVFAAAGAAIVATALLHILLLTTPRPLSFFEWIVGLATVVVVLYPFSTGAPIEQKVATAVVNLIIGICIGSLLTSVGARSIRSRTVVREYPVAPGEYPADPRGEYPARPRRYPPESDYPTRPYEPTDGDQGRYR
jgi:Family of unknown function (DUF6069)